MKIINPFFSLLFQTLEADQSNVQEPYEEFMLWAFGDLNLELDILHFMNRWNDLHGDLKKLHINGDIIEDIKNMIQIWLNHRFKDE